MDQQSRWTETSADAPHANGQSESEPGRGFEGRSVGSGKADLSKRFIAAVIDCVIAVVIGIIPVIGGLIAAAYWLVRDGLAIEFMDGRSIGKKVMKLRPVRLDGRPMDIPTSVRRNWMFAFGGVVSLLLSIPILGWLLVIPVALLALALGLLETYKVVTDPRGRRLGDTMAGTEVIEVES